MKSTFFKAIIALLFGIYAALFCCCSDDDKNNSITPYADNIADSTYTVNGVTFKMRFAEGNDTISSFYIGETEVTQELWEAVMGSNPSVYKNALSPVENIAYTEVQDFITQLNTLTGKTFRLPTAKEWEFAAKGGNKTHNYIYSGSNTLSEVANADNSYGDGENYPIAAKSKLYNELGIYDMTGNVWELTSEKQLRGGSFISLKQNCEISYIYYGNIKNFTVGLRLAINN